MKTQSLLKLKGQLYEDFRNFVHHLWTHLNLPPPTEVQYDIAEWLQSGPRRRMVKAFRGVGKSWLTAAYVLWRLLKNPNERILVVSASKERADGFTVFVRQLIEDVPILRKLRPKPGQRDSVIAFDVGGSEPHQSPSVKSAGITGMITGSRATIIVADDIENPANSLTQMLRDRLAEQVKEFDAILLPGGEIVYLGTDQTEMSLYKQLPHRGYEVRVWPARTPATLKKYQSYGDTLSPLVLEQLKKHGAWKPMDAARFDEYDLLEREASYGRSGFAMQFMLDPSIGDAERYPLKASDLIVADVQEDVGYSELYWGSAKEQVIQDLECVGLPGDRYHRPLSARLSVTDAPAPPYTGSVMFIDPSGGGKDETAYAVVKMCLGKLYLMASGGFIDGFSNTTLDKLAAIARDHKVNLILTEPNYGGGMFDELLKPALKRVGYAVTVESSEWAKVQKEKRIIDVLQPILGSHKLVVGRRVLEQDRRAGEDYDCGNEYRIHYQLMHQLTRVTRERGSLRQADRVDALAGACHYFALQVGRDEQQALKDHQEALQEQALEQFLEDCDGASGLVTNNWNPPRPMK